MRLQSMDYFCCPACNGSFELSTEKVLEAEVIQGVLKCCECKRYFEINNGLPNLNFPESLEPSDLKQQMAYDRHPQWYDLRNRLDNLKVGAWEYAFMENRGMHQLINCLELRKNTSVLETGTGTGRYLPGIANQIGKEGQLHGSDISAGMLKVAQRKMKAKGIQAELVQANASYLPYRTAAFHTVFHNGGLDTFADKKRAIEEMHRVAKSGSKIVVCDEGLAPGKEKTLMGRWILKRHKIYASKPPVELVPDNTEDLKVHWLWHGLCWVVEFKKRLNLHQVTSIVM